MVREQWQSDFPWKCRMKIPLGAIKQRTTMWRVCNYAQKSDFLRCAGCGQHLETAEPIPENGSRLIAAAAAGRLN